MLIEVTRKCMMECPHCMVCATPDGVHMDTKIFTRSIKFAKAIGDMSINISGGDPFYHPDIFKLIRYVADEFKGKVGIGIQSNGWWIEDEKLVSRIKHLLDQPYIFELQISSHSKYYKNHQFTLSHESDYRKLSNKVSFGTDWQILRYGGRAKNIMKPEEVVLGPDCLQYICYALGIDQRFKVNSMDTWIKMSRLHGKFCIPYVDVYGRVKIGEMDDCQVLFNMNDHNIFDNKFLNSIFKKIQGMIPCNNCHGCDTFKYQTYQKPIFEQLKLNLK